MNNLNPAKRAVRAKAGPSLSAAVPGKVSTRDNCIGCSYENLIPAPKSLVFTNKFSCKLQDSNLKSIKQNEGMFHRRLAQQRKHLVWKPRVWAQEWLLGEDKPGALLAGYVILAVSGLYLAGQLVRWLLF